MAENELLLSVKNLTVEYTSEGEVIHAVNNVSFDLEKGKTIGLVGETGAGKTSIARSILRILPEPPARVPNGEIFFEGKDLLKIREEDMQKIRGKEISMIFQDPMTALNPIMRVGEQIAEVIKLHEHCSKGESVEKAKKMLEMVGIPGERYYEYPHQFSGGMKQRVVIARALACSPTLLLADEPTTALDVTIQAQVLDMINDANLYWFPEEAFTDQQLAERFLSEIPVWYGIKGYLKENPDTGLKQYVIEKPVGSENLNYVQGDYVLEKQLADMDRAGIDRAVLKLSCQQQWMSLDMCRLFNDGMAAHVKASGGRMAALGVVPP